MQTYHFTIVQYHQKSARPRECFAGKEDSVFFPDLFPNRKIHTRDGSPPKEKISTGGTVFKAKWMKTERGIFKEKKKKIKRP